MKDSLLFITEKPTDSLSSGMDKRPILITLLITLLGSVSDLLDFQRFSDSRKCRFSSNPLRSTIRGSANALPFFFVLGYHICIESEVKNGIYSQRRKTGRFQYTAN